MAVQRPLVDARNALGSAGIESFIQMSHLGRCCHVTWSLPGHWSVCGVDETIQRGHKETRLNGWTPRYHKPVPVLRRVPTMGRSRVLSAGYQRRVQLALTTRRNSFLVEFEYFRVSRRVRELVTVPRAASVSPGRHVLDVFACLCKSPHLHVAAAN